MPARLLGRREPSGGHVECLLLRQIDDESMGRADASRAEDEAGHAREFRRATAQLEAEVLAQHTFGRRTIRLWPTHGGSVAEVVDAIGHMPLPPYIKRDDSTGGSRAIPDDLCQPPRIRGGAHGGAASDDGTARSARAARRDRAEVTLHVGYGTFEPVRTDVVEEHRLHPEPFEIDATAARAIATAQREGRRIVSVGTTTTRTLEAVAAEHGGIVHEASGEASLYIYPGFRFQVAGGLLTNFHLPKSSLLLLVCAFAGTELTLAAYGTRSPTATGFTATGMRCWSCELRATGYEIAPIADGQDYADASDSISAAASSGISSS